MRDIIDLCSKADLLELNGYKNTDEFKGVKQIGAQNRLSGNAAMDAYKRNGLMKTFVKNLEAKGYRAVGKPGAYGCVLTHPGLTYAIKVFQDDPAYMRFVKLALANQDNPHFPRFQGKFMKIDERHTAVRIELLEQLDAEHAEQIEDAVHAYTEREIYPEEFEDHEDLFEQFPDLSAAIEGILDLCRTGPVRLDLNVRNIMCRANGEPVFTDPVAPKG